ncbi:hypothetical protein FQN50_003539 [Emmonsiellopsis sp. PD_5]|nr:hypothetical protein FQN50_003539 [Emmonsiellopsis sp. PD_5]
MLHLLPTELLMLIHAHLPPSAQLTLSMACTRFHAIFFTPIPNSRSAVADYALLRAREFCGFKCTAFLTCSACKETHSRLSFHPSALDTPPNARICIAHTPALWFEPGRLFSYNELYRATRGYSPRAIRTPRSALLCIDRHSRVYPSYTLWTHHALLTVPTHTAASKIHPRLTHLLSHLHLPACPHLLLSNPHLTPPSPRHLPTHTITTPLTPSLPPLFDPADTLAHCPHPSCQTSFRYTTHTHPSNPARKTLYLHILRELGALLPSTPISTPRDATWCAQLIAPDDIPACARVWERGMRWKEEVGVIDAKRYALDEEDLEPAEKNLRLEELQRCEEMVTEHYLRDGDKPVVRPLFTPEELKAFTNPQPKRQGQAKAKAQLPIRPERDWLVDTFVKPVVKALSFN